MKNSLTPIEIAKLAQVTGGTAWDTTKWAGNKAASVAKSAWNWYSKPTSM